MALQWIEGFETIDVTTGGSTTSSVAEYLNAIGCTGVFTSDTGIYLVPSVDTNHFALSFGGSSLAFNNYLVFPLKNLVQLGNAIVIGFRMKTPASSRSWEAIQCYDRDGNIAFNLTVANTSTMSVVRNLTTLGTTDEILSENTWYYVELKYLIHSSAGAYELRVDGETVLSGTNVNTKDVNADDLASVRFRSPTAGTNNEFHIDDIYILDDTGDVNNSFLGPCIVRGLLPDGDGETNEWTPSSGSSHYAMVDEQPLTLEDYVESGETGRAEMFSMSPCNVTGVKAVLAQAFMATDKAQVKAVHVKVVSGESVEDAESEVVSDTTPTVVGAIFEVDPNTSSAWEAEAINSAEFGVEID